VESDPLPAPPKPPNRAIIAAAVCIAALGYGYLLDQRRHDHDYDRSMAELDRSIKSVTRSTEAIFDEIAASQVQSAIQQLQSRESSSGVLDPAQGVAQQLAQELASTRPTGEANDSSKRRTEVLGDRRLTWFGYEVSVRRLSDDGEPDTVWAGGWLILLVTTDRDASNRSIVALTDQFYGAWTRDGAADIDDVAASLGADPVKSLQRAGWRPASEFTPAADERDREVGRQASGDDDSDR
jgi:hypothetical protein